MFSIAYAFSICSCEKSIEAFDNSTNFIYFNLPFSIDEYGATTKKHVDSLIYSFAMDDASVREYTFKLPINTIGLVVENDRPFKVEVVENKTTASNDDWDRISIENPIIKKGALKDTLYITVNRSLILETEWRCITLRLQENNFFKLNLYDLLEAKMSFTDILLPPTWWEAWSGVFGEFSREKFVKWQEIYYLGADSKLAKDGPKKDQPLYWDNMPSGMPWQEFHPSTFMFIAKLKQYFIDNEVYPDGDRTKPRITIPHEFE